MFRPPATFLKALRVVQHQDGLEVHQPLALWIADSTSSLLKSAIRLCGLSNTCLPAKMLSPVQRE